MTQSQIYPMSSQNGYGIAVNGNFAAITIFEAGETPSYSVTVSSFATDFASQHRIFQDLDQAVEWAIATARTHQGKPNAVSRIVHWENRKGYAITISETKDGRYETGTFPMWINDDHYPYLNAIQDFPAMAEALEYAREQVDRYYQSEDGHRQLVKEIGERLRAHAGEQETNP